MEPKANFIVQACRSAKDLLARERVGPRPTFLIRAVAAYLLLALGVSIAHLFVGFTIPLDTRWIWDFAGFFVVTLSIVSAGKELSRYYLEKVSLLCIIIFPGFLGRVPAQAPSWVVLLSYVLPAVLGVFLFARLRAIGALRGGQLADAAEYLFVGAVLAGLMILVQMGETGFRYPYDQMVSSLLGAGPVFVLARFGLNMSTIAAIEEPLLRGFLLGHLVNVRRWKPAPALLVQALAFTVPHIYLLHKPYDLFFAIPLTGLILGWVTVRTGNIATALFAHAIYGVVVDIVALVETP